MKITIQKLFAFLVLVLTYPLYSAAQFQYISPAPSSKFHDPTTNIILKNGGTIRESSLRKNLFSVKGSVSGNHAFDIKIAEEGATVILKPLTPFTEGETVSVAIGEGMITGEGAAVKGTAFTFDIRAPRTPEEQARIKAAMEKIYQDEFGAAAMPSQGGDTREVHQGIPDLTISTNTNPTAGDIFFHNFNFLANQDPHYCIIKNNGDSVFGKFDTITFNNFALNHSGYMTVYNKKDSFYAVLDSNYNKINELRTGNGYLTDVHECQMFKNKTFLISYDPQVFDMTIYNPSYSPDAIVVGCIVQELDNHQNVIFQWRSWDHFEVTDASHVLFTTDVIDYVHGNSIELDNDGNILLSCRHMDEITKININTGDIIWRLGGSHNEFTFTNDPPHFSRQHDVRRIANGNITLFDNGNYHVPPRSYAKEYQVDEVNKTATLAWSYSRVVASGPVFGNAMGSVQRLTNGIH
jgi:hypothetical protein